MLAVINFVSDHVIVSLGADHCSCLLKFIILMKSGTLNTMGGGEGVSPGGFGRVCATSF